LLADSVLVCRGFESTDLVICADKRTDNSDNPTNIAKRHFFTLRPREKFLVQGILGARAVRTKFICIKRDQDCGKSRAAGLSIIHVNEPLTGWISCAGRSSGREGPNKTSFKTSALSAPATRK